VAKKSTTTRLEAEIASLNSASEVICLTADISGLMLYADDEVCAAFADKNLLIKKTMTTSRTKLSITEGKNGWN